MTSPLSGSLANTIYVAFKSLFLDATLTREVVPESPAYDPADPPAVVPVNFPCLAMRDRYSVQDKANSDILDNDSKILVLANSLATTPIKDDLITFAGKTYSVISFDIDPANAVWTIQGRN